MFVPYLYYASFVYNYGQEHQPEGFNFPHISEFWRTIVGAVVSQSAKRLVQKLLVPSFYKVAKVKTTEEIQIKYAKRATENFYQVLQLSIVSVWGYYVLKDTKFMPWFMGGSNDS